MVVRLGELGDIYDNTYYIYMYMHEYIHKYIHTYIHRQIYIQTHRASDEAGPRGAFAPKKESWGGEISGRQ